MDIHQIQVKYDAAADRLLMQVRTRAGEVVGVWLTRRMMLRLWPHFDRAVTHVAVQRTAPDATVMPEAREMLQQAARERPLPHADFSKQFDPQPAARPLGTEPLLPTEINLTPSPTGALALRLREEGGRSLELRLGEELSSALLRLVEKALRASGWGLLPDAAPPAAAAPPGALN